MILLKRRETKRLPYEVNETHIPPNDTIFSLPLQLRFSEKTCIMKEKSQKEIIYMNEFQKYADRALELGAKDAVVFSIDQICFDSRTLLK